MSLQQRLEPALALADRGIRTLKIVAPLLTRFVFGVAFVHAGMGKWHDLDRTAAFFEGLGIPAPAANAAFVAAVEVVGGGALVLGFLTRLFAALLSCTMIVALVTAHPGDLAEAFTKSSETGLTDIAAVVFLLAMLGLIAFGPGPLSLDRLLPWKGRAVA